MSQTPPPQPPYGPPNQYGAPAYGPMVPDHPQSMTVLILGIVSVAVCGVVGPFAWVMGSRVLREIDASNGQLGGRSQTQAGRIMGIVTPACSACPSSHAAAVLVIALILAATSPT